MRYSRILEKDVRESEYSPRRAYARLQAMACKEQCNSVPIAIGGFMGAIFYSLRMRVDGDLMMPSLPDGYVFADEGATVAVISLLYVAVRRQVKEVRVCVDRDKDRLLLSFEGELVSEDAAVAVRRFEEQGEGKGLFSLLRGVAKNSGIGLTCHTGETFGFSLRFSRSASEIQEVHASDGEQRDRVNDIFIGILPLLGRSIL